MLGIYRKLKNFIAPKDFKSSEYWNQRYLTQGNSGVGSYGKFAEFKANVLNDFVKENDVRTILELGCGDGNQLSLANYPSYVGLDVSETIVQTCKEKFINDTTKQFYSTADYVIEDDTFDLTLSLDVIYHLVEDDVYAKYMSDLFRASKKYTIIYASNDENIVSDAVHVRHRCFTNWVEKNLPNWKLKEAIKNIYPYNGDYKETSFSDFYIFEKMN